MCVQGGQFGLASKIWGREGDHPLAPAVPTSLNTIEGCRMPSILINQTILVSNCDQFWAFRWDWSKSRKKKEIVLSLLNTIEFRHFYSENQKRF